MQWTRAKSGSAEVDSLDMYDNPEKTKQMGIAAKSRIENQLSSKQTVIELKALYEKIISE